MGDADAPQPAAPVVRPHKFRCDNCDTKHSVVCRVCAQAALANQLEAEEAAARAEKELAEAAAKEARRAARAAAIEQKAAEVALRKAAEEAEAAVVWDAADAPAKEEFAREAALARDLAAQAAVDAAAAQAAQEEVLGSARRTARSLDTGLKRAQRAADPVKAAERAEALGDARKAARTKYQHAHATAMVYADSCTGSGDSGKGFAFTLAHGSHTLARLFSPIALEAPPALLCAMAGRELDTDTFRALLGARDVAELCSLKPEACMGYGACSGAAAEVDNEARGRMLWALGCYFRGVGGDVFLGGGGPSIVEAMTTGMEARKAIVSGRLDRELWPGAPPPLEGCASLSPAFAPFLCPRRVGQPPRSLPLYVSVELWWEATGLVGPASGDAAARRQFAGGLRFCLRGVCHVAVTAAAAALLATDGCEGLAPGDCTVRARRLLPPLWDIVFCAMQSTAAEDGAELEHKTSVARVALGQYCGALESTVESGHTATLGALLQAGNHEGVALAVTLYPLLLPTLSLLLAQLCADPQHAVLVVDARRLGARLAIATAASACARTVVAPALTLHSRVDVDLLLEPRLQVAALCDDVALDFGGAAVGGGGAELDASVLFEGGEAALVAAVAATPARPPAPPERAEGEEKTASEMVAFVRARARVALGVSPPPWITKREQWAGIARSCSRPLALSFALLFCRDSMLRVTGTRWVHEWRMQRVYQLLALGWAPARAVQRLDSDTLPEPEELRKWLQQVVRMPQLVEECVKAGKLAAPADAPWCAEFRLERERTRAALRRAPDGEAP